MRPFYTQAQEPNIAPEPAALYLTLVAPQLSAHVSPLNDGSTTRTADNTVTP